MNCREIAYLACLSAERGEGFISEKLKLWEKENTPSKLDLHLAQEIAYGTCRMSLTLNEYAKQLTNNKLNLKRKERVLLFTGLYQYYFLEKIPLYAISNETITIAKKYCHINFVKFLNAIFRKLATQTVSLPTEMNPEALSIKYSYPLFFVKTLIEEYSIEEVIQILEAGNLPPKQFARHRANLKDNFEMIDISEDISLADFTNTSHYYIQNSTPSLLMQSLGKSDIQPSKILDLCSAPGGKLIAAHDLFPEAKLFANDVSETKLQLIQENLDKYQIEASLSLSRGEAFVSNQKYDLILLDVPCSNTGVLNKRAEARWRLTSENLEALKTLQFNLLSNAKTLLNEQGEIWYMTCSILSDENEELIHLFCKQNDFEIVRSHKIIPNQKGADGGFGCVLRKSFGH